MISRRECDFGYVVWARGQSKWVYGVQIFFSIIPDLIKIIWTTPETVNEKYLIENKINTVLYSMLGLIKSQ